MRYLVLGLALAVTATVALLLAVLEPFGGSNGGEDTQQAGEPVNVCDLPLPPLGSGEISEEHFDMADAGMDRVIVLARAGDIAAASSIFASQVHDFTHDVDAPLRERDEDLAKRLCNAVAAVEALFAYRGGAAEIAQRAEEVRGLLREAAAGFGFEGHESRTGMPLVRAEGRPSPT